MKTNIQKSLLLFMLVMCYLIYHLIIYFPMVGEDFDFWHSAIALKTEMIGFIDPNVTTLGFSLSTTILSLVTGISCDFIPFLPLMAIPFIIILLSSLGSIFCAFLNHEEANILSFLIVLVIITRFGNKIFFAWWSHNMGFILFLIIIYLLSIQLKNENTGNRKRMELSILVIISIISLNFISYKLAVLCIIFLTTIQFLKLLQNSKKLTYINLILLSIIFISIFNKIFYYHFIPFMRLQSEFYSSGIHKLLFQFDYHSADPLNDFYFKTPAIIRDANTIWLLLLLFLLLILTIILTRNLIISRSFSYAELIILSLILSNLFIISIYGLMGLLDFTYLIIISLLGLPILYGYSNKLKYLTFSSILIFLFINVFVTYNYNDLNIYEGMRDDDFNDYLMGPSSWYIDHLLDYVAINHIRTETDVFTGGFVSKEIIKNNESSDYLIESFLKESLLNILVPESRTSNDISMVYIINYRLNHFSGNFWNVLRSWSNFRPLLQDYLFLSKVFSSGFSDIFIGTK